MSKRIAVLGAGSWGMAIGHLLHRSGCDVILWENSEVDYARLIRTRANPDKLKSFSLDKKIDLVPIADKQRLLKTMEGHILGQGQIIGKYKRQ